SKGFLHFQLQQNINTMKTKVAFSGMAKFCFIILLPVLIVSCAVSSKVRKNVSYISITFSKYELESGGLALIPNVAGSGVEGYRKPFGVAMDSVGVATLDNFMKWRKTLDKINKAGLVEEYSNAIQSYQETGIINRNILQEM